MSNLQRASSWLSIPLAILLLAAVAPSVHSDEAALRNRWHGAWVVTDLELTSDCGARYTNNDIRGRLVSGNGSYRFEPGELASVYKIDLKRSRIDVLIDLAEPFLVPHQEGPFTLYDESRCKVELEVRLPEGVSFRDTESIDDLLLGLLERYETVSAAEASPNWNQRVMADYPPDYDRTVAEYQVWKVGQINAAVQDRIDESLERASRIIDRVDGDDPEYTAGFGAGIEEASGEYLTSDCDRLLEMSEATFVDSPPSGESGDWKKGYRDGQRLVFYLELAREVPNCFLPPPPLPRPG